MFDWDRALALGNHWFVLGTALAAGLAVVSDEGIRTLMLQ